MFRYNTGMNISKQTQTGKEQKPVYKDTNLHVIFSITLMAVMGVASIAPAFPKIVESLNISKNEIGLLVTVFTFPGIVLTPILGILADRFGRKKVLVPSLFLFGIAGGACAFTRDFNTLLLFRFFQGVGAASLGSLNTTIIGDLYALSRQRMSEAMGYNAGILNIGTASYPAIGGLLAALGWNYPFLMPIAAVPVGLLVLFFLKNPEPKGGQRIKDYLKNTWKCFQDKQVAGLFSLSLVTFIILYGVSLTYFPFFMKESFGASVVVIGLFMSVMSVGSGITSTQLGRLTKKYSRKALLLTAFVLYTLALTMLPFVPKLWMAIIPTLIYGIGNGLNIPTIHSLLASLSPLEYRAAFMSANGMVLRMGQTLGPIVMGMVFVIGGLSATFFAGAGLALLMLVLIKSLIK